VVTHLPMPEIQQRIGETGPQRIKLTARLTLPACDALVEIQRLHRRKTGRAIRLWKVLDTAVIIYARKQGIAVGD